MINPRSHILQKCTSCRTAFFCCDIQEKLVDKIPNFQNAVKVSNKLSRLYEQLPREHFSFLATEQYPQGVGHLHKDIILPKDAPVFAKMTPSMLTKDVVDYLKSDGKEPVQQVVLWGHETHVCILQTADALLQQNIRVAICLDGCSAQRKIDHDAAVLSMSRWDGLVFSTPIGILLQLTQGDASLMTKEMMRLAKPEPHQEL